MQIDHKIKMSYKEDMIKSKEEHIKLFQKREKLLTQENKELCKVITAKEVEVLLVMEAMEDYEHLE